MTHFSLRVGAAITRLTHDLLSTAQNCIAECLVAEISIPEPCVPAEMEAFWCRVKYALCRIRPVSPRAWHVIIIHLAEAIWLFKPDVLRVFNFYQLIAVVGVVQVWRWELIVLTPQARPWLDGELGDRLGPYYLRWIVGRTRRTLGLLAKVPVVEYDILNARVNEFGWLLRTVV